MRLFLAVDPAERERRELDQLQRRLRPCLDGVRWVSPENMHLTLKFLGETDPGLLARIGAALERAAASLTGYDYRLKGLGVFPDPLRARVIWTGMEEGRLETEALFSRLEAELASLGFIRDRRRYFPHLTLGRFGRSPVPETLRPLLAREKDFATGRGRIEKIVLYRSHLSGEGAKYEPLLEKYLSEEAGNK